MFSLNSAFAYNIYESGTVKGSVYNPINNSAVKLVKVSLKNVINNTISEVITNEKGDFVIRDIPFGEYVLTTKLDGFEKSTIYNVVIMKENPLAEVSRIELNKSIESENGMVMGAVYNSLDNSAVKLAKVSLKNVINNTISEVITNEKGDFVIRDIPFGEYVLTTKIDGFEKSTIYNVVLMKEKPVTEVSRIELNESIEFQSGTLMGSVFDSTTNEPVKYAAITVYNCLTRSLSGIGVTNDKGEFKIDDLPFGEYCLKASYTGFYNHKIYNVVLMRQNPKVNLNRIQLIRENANIPLPLIF